MSAPLKTSPPARQMDKIASWLLFIPPPVGGNFAQ
jgi:hypothetical protein